MLGKDFLKMLEEGKLRVAQKEDDEWIVDPEIKQQILEVFRGNQNMEMSSSNYPGFIDKEPLSPRVFKTGDSVRMVPGGSSVRAGVHVGRNVVIMPPSYANIGAYIDENSMIDSHVLVGSCAQVGKNVHLSTAVQIGGVLEPVGNMPVIVEDDCFIGAGVILTEGILVRSGAVIAPNVSLSASVPIYDVVNKEIIKGEIPENAVVVPGTRPILDNRWANDLNLSLGCAIIVKYRDQKTSNAVALENALR